MAADFRRVLVVEDSPTMRQLYRMVLGGEDVALAFADDGLEGLDLAAQSPDLDLLIVDVNMPRMDGLEFLRRVRTELGLATPAIVVSTEGEAADREAARAAGADAYLTKPWTPVQLREALAGLRGAAGAG